MDLDTLLHGERAGRPWPASVPSATIDLLCSDDRARHDASAAALSCQVQNGSKALVGLASEGVRIPLTSDDDAAASETTSRPIAAVAARARQSFMRLCGLRWDYEVDVPGLRTSVFIIPRTGVENGDDRLVALNRVAASVVSAPRGRHLTHVFAYEGERIGRMLRSAWKRARRRAELDQMRVHDLKYTFGRRLRAVGVSFEDGQDLLRHRSGRITTHYSAAELGKLIEAANRVCDRDERRQDLMVLRGVLHRSLPQNSRKRTWRPPANPDKSLKRLVARARLELATYGL